MPLSPCDSCGVPNSHLTNSAQFNYDRAKNLRPKRNIRTAMNHEIMMYGIAQVI